jgi:hypothetical protein
MARIVLSWCTSLVIMYDIISVEWWFVETIAINGICQNFPLHCLKQCKERKESRKKTEFMMVCVACACSEHFHALPLQGPRSGRPSVSQGHVHLPNELKVRPIRHADMSQHLAATFASSLFFLPSSLSCHPLWVAFAIMQSAHGNRCLRAWTKNSVNGKRTSKKCKRFKRCRYNITIGS